MHPPVERLFPFALRARVVIPGRQRLASARKRLEFILLTTDLSENSRRDLVEAFPGCPMLDRYTADDIERLFGFRNTKVLGFVKSSLARSILSELRGQGDE